MKFKWRADGLKKLGRPTVDAPRLRQNGDALPYPVIDGEIQIAVGVKIACAHETRAAPGLEVGRYLEGSVASAEKNGDATRGLADSQQVRRTVAVQIAYQDGVGLPSDREVLGCHESATAVATIVEDRARISGLIRSRNVQVTVPVNVKGYHVVRVTAERIGRSHTEGSLGIQKYRDKWQARATRNDVDPAVTVEVSHGDRGRVTPDAWVRRTLSNEGSVAPI